MLCIGRVAWHDDGVPGCHPLDELQPATWQANPAKAINYFEQFAHQLHSARRPTLFSFLQAGGLSGPLTLTLTLSLSLFYCCHSRHIQGFLHVLPALANTRPEGCPSLCKCETRTIANRCVLCMYVRRLNNNVVVWPRLTVTSCNVLCTSIQHLHTNLQDH